MIPQPLKESKTEFAMRLYDTSVPQITACRAASIAGVHKTTLYEALRTRERLMALRCPHCRRYPGQRVRGGLGPSGTPMSDLERKASARRALGLPEALTARTKNRPPHHTPPPTSPQPSE